MQENQPALTFGPIPSRRFGISLGIDLSPDIKQCNFDCLYCELKGAKTVSEQSTSPKVEDVIAQVKEAMKKHPKIDVLTLTANGEPTLYPYLTELIEQLNFIKGNAKTLILSNGGNIYNKNIQNSLKKLDIVKLSLDCVSEKCFKKLDRTDKSIDCTKIVEGIVEFKNNFQNDLIIEVLFVQGINDNDVEIELIAKALDKIKPNRVDIGTIDRPPAYDVKSVSFDTLQSIANKFIGQNVSIAYKNRPKAVQSYSDEEIINLLKRRPLTVDDIENMFDNDSQKRVDNLLNHSILGLVEVSGVKFYKFL